MKIEYRIVGEDDEDGLEEAWGDVSGAVLDPKLLKGCKEAGHRLCAQDAPLR